MNTVYYTDNRTSVRVARLRRELLWWKGVCVFQTVSVIVYTLLNT